MLRFLKVVGFLSLLLLALGTLIYIAVPHLRFRTIVVHHSASASDNYASIKGYHKTRGWRDAAYHLILSNGSTSVPLGFLEAGSRYRLLSYSPATRSGWCNLTGLHLCLVGDYDQTRVPPQLDPSLAHALQALQQKFHIPDSQILFHRDCSPTSCPGRFVTKEALRAWLDTEAARCPQVIKDQHHRIIDSASLPFGQLFWPSWMAGLERFWGLIKTSN
ncbi:MAG: peptidoglycan recognition family protein [Thermodesulfobacteriota bacterium]